MTLKEKTKSDVSKVITDGHEIEKRILGLVKREYITTLMKSKKSSSKLKGNTKAILTGIDEGFKHAEAKSKNAAKNLKEQNVKKGKIIQNAAHSFVQITKEKNNEKIKTAKKNTEKAKAKLVLASHKLGDKMKGVNVKTKEKMEETLKQLHQTNKESKDKLEAVSGGIKDYTKDKTKELKERTVKGLNSARDKSKKSVKSIEESSKKHTKKIISSSLTKTSSWLNKLSSKVNKDK